MDQIPVLEDVESSICIETQLIWQGRMILGVAQELSLKVASIVRLSFRSITEHSEEVNRRSESVYRIGRNQRKRIVSNGQWLVHGNGSAPS